VDLYCSDNIEVFIYEKSPRLRIKKPEKIKDGNKEDDFREEISEEQRYQNKLRNARQAKKNFQRLVAANLVGDSPLFITLTYKEEIFDIEVGYKDYMRFIQKLRYKFGKNFRCIGVPEFQGNGRVHFHIVIWSLPIIAKQERKDRIIAQIWGHGFVDLKETDGNIKISGYVAKYMSKAFKDKNLKNKKSYVATRNVIRPIITKNTLLTYALHDKVGENDKPVIDRSYQTQWQGKCRELLFKITKNE
jgi:hypothetical protein